MKLLLVNQIVMKIFLPFCQLDFFRWRTVLPVICFGLCSLSALSECLATSFSVFSSGECDGELTHRE